MVTFTRLPVYPDAQRIVTDLLPQPVWTFLEYENRVRPSAVCNTTTFMASKLNTKISKSDSYRGRSKGNINMVISIQASLVIRHLTLRVFAITRFRGKKKAVRKLYSNFAVTVYGGGVTVWRAHQLVTSYQYQCERECSAS